MSGHMPVCLLNQRGGQGDRNRHQQMRSRLPVLASHNREDSGRALPRWHRGQPVRRMSAQGRSANYLSTFQPSPPNAESRMSYSPMKTGFENNTRRIAIFEKIARRLYEEWFVRYRFPGHEGVKMIDSDSGLIPEDWDLGTLGQLVTAVKEPYVEAVHGNFPLIDLSRIPRRSSAIREFGDADDLKTSRIVCNSGDILFGSIRPYLHKVLRSPVEAVTNISVHVLRSIDTKEGAYEWMVLFSDETVAWAVQHSSGLKMPTIPWPVLTKMPVIIPTSDLREHFQQNIGTIAELIGVLVVKNTNLRTQRDILLPKLISGEIDVSEIGEQMAEAAAE